MAGLACLRRLRRFRDPRSRSLRGLRSLRRARAPAPRLVPYGVRGQNPARESRDAHPAGGCMARHARATAARWRWLSALIRTTRMNTVSRLVGGGNADLPSAPKGAPSHMINGEPTVSRDFHFAGPHTVVASTWKQPGYHWTTRLLSPCRAWSRG